MYIKPYLRAVRVVIGGKAEEGVQLAELEIKLCVVGLQSDTEGRRVELGFEVVGAAKNKNNIKQNDSDTEYTNK